MYSNTSPLSNLAVVGHLPLLWRFYERIIIPTAVWDELSELGGGKALEALEDARAEGLIQVLEVQNQSLVLLLCEDLHQGEAEAIALACEGKADLLLMDEHDGRAAAERLGIPISGVLGVLRRARREGLIGPLKAEILRLRTQAHFFIAPKLEEALLRSVGEMA